jgi:endogenous inhibitor of DNA gyrase (YacG/DUF329 family)
MDVQVDSQRYACPECKKIVNWGDGNENANTIERRLM